MIALALPRSGSESLIAASWILYLVMWAGGIFSYTVLGGVRAGDEWTAPVFLTLAALIVLASAPLHRAAALIGAGVLGFLVEWVGLQGGWVFSEYTYTDALAPRLFGVPLVMISAWMVLVAYVRELLRPLLWPPALQVAGGAALLTAIDLVIDPLAAGPLGYWTWHTAGAFHGVPAHNFAGWFAAGLLILAVLHAADRANTPVGNARPVGLSVVLFFTILAAVYGLALPAAAGALVCAADVWLARSGVAPQASR